MPVSRVQLSAVLCGTALLLALPPARGESVPSRDDAWRSRAEHQQRARAMARELVSSVLDAQLRQLEENGLAESEVHAAIAAMRGQIEALVDTEMAAAIEMLAEIESLPEQERPAKYDRFRGQVRQIVARLSAERQTLVQRLKVAGLAAQVRQLVGLQASVLERTETLSLDDQPRLLSAIHDQRDVGTLLGQLVASLGTMSDLAGATGAEAAAGLRLLATGRAVEHAAAAQSGLESARFPAAAESQRAALAALTALADRLTPPPRSAMSDREAAVTQVRELVSRQEKLRERTRQAGTNDRVARLLVAEQSAIHAEIKRLVGAVGRFPNAAALVERADAAAYEAVSRLFAGKPRDAVAVQERVLGALGELEGALLGGSQAAAGAASAVDMARELSDLRRALEQVGPLEAHLRDIAPAAAANAPAAAAAARAAAERMGAIEKSLPPGPVQTRVGQARDALERAAVAPPERPAEVTEAAIAARNAVERAAAEMRAAIADGERQQLAVKIGELSRAAEVLDRAAAAAERLTDRTSAAGGPQRPEADRQGVADVVAAAEEALREIAPAAGKNLQAAAAGLRASPSAPAAEPRAAAAEQLAAAAADVRAEMSRAAAELAAVAGRQLETVQAAARAAEDVLAAMPSSGAPPIAPQALARQADALAQQAAAVAPEATAALRRAEQAAVAGSDARGAEEAARRGMEDAATSLEARAERIRRDQDLAQAVQELARQQQESRGDLAELGAALAQAEKKPAPDVEPSPVEPPAEESVEPPADKGTKSKGSSGKTSKQKGKGPSGTAQQSEDLAAAPAAKPAARAADADAADAPAADEERLAAELAAAARQFADAQRATGQAAIDISGQREVGNPALREALEAASDLAVPPPAGDGPQPPVAAAPAPAPQPAPGAAAAPNQSPSLPAASPPAAAAQAARPAPPQPPAPASMGTGFLPQSPEATAEMIAGLPPQSESGADSPPSPSGSEPLDPQSSPGQANMSKVRSPAEAKGETDSLGGGIDEGGVSKGQGKGSSPKGEGHGQGPSTAASSKAQRGESPPAQPGPDGPGAGQGGQASATPPPPSQASSQQPGGQGQGGQGQGPTQGPPQPSASAPPPSAPGQAPPAASQAQSQPQTGQGQGSGAGISTGPSSGSAQGQGATQSFSRGQRAPGGDGPALEPFRNLEGEAWVARLPPEFRRAIRADVQRRAPRAYEERLRRYFQSVD